MLVMKKNDASLKILRTVDAAEQLYGSITQKLMEPNMLSWNPCNWKQLKLCI